MDGTVCADGKMVKVSDVLFVNVILVLLTALLGTAVVVKRPRARCTFICSYLFRPPRTACGVDPNRGPKIFLDACVIRKSNHCNGTAYRPMPVKRCLKMFPEIKYEYYKFEDVKDYHGETNI